MGELLHIKNLTKIFALISLFSIFSLNVAKADPMKVCYVFNEPIGEGDGIISKN